MWFGKWFSRRSEVEDDEPARYAPPPTVKPVPRAAAKPAAPVSDTAKGFDPYNSGAFERRNAWERVGRR